MYQAVMERGRELKRELKDGEEEDYMSGKKKKMMAEIEKKHRDIQKQQMTKDKSLIRVALRMRVDGDR